MVAALVFHSKKCYCELNVESTLLRFALLGNLYYKARATFMQKCEVCQADYEMHAHGCIVCDDCSYKVATIQPRLLSVAQRLWSKSFQVSGCWEFGTPQQDGRPSKVMMDHRQWPAQQVALHLSGQPQPSGRHYASTKCGNPMCVRPPHLEWLERVEPERDVAMFEHMTKEELVWVLSARRAKKAQYQRSYRRKLKTKGDYTSSRERTVEDPPASGKVELWRHGMPPEHLPPAPLSIEQRRAATLARWEAMTESEQTAALASLPRELIDDSRALTLAAEVLGVPAGIAGDTLRDERAVIEKAQVARRPAVEFEPLRVLDDDDGPIVTAAELAALEAEATAPEPARAEPEPVASEPEPAASAVKPEPVAGQPVSEPEPVSALLASLAGAKIAPVD